MRFLDCGPKRAATLFMMADAIAHFVIPRATGGNIGAPASSNDHVFGKFAFARPRAPQYQVNAVFNYSWGHGPSFPCAMVSTRDPVA
jgi:hypothetical protein